MDWWQAIVLGIVEGLTEFLPVSSTGHLILASGAMGLNGEAHKANVDAFNVVIQGGAILAVLGLYRGRVLQMIRGLAGRDRAGFLLARAIVIAFLPAAVLGVLLGDWIEAKLFFLGPVTAALMLGGVLMIVLDRGVMRPRRAEPEAAPGDAWIERLTPARSLMIGALQCAALCPGVSRSMMTIGGGVIAGLRGRQAAEFSFLLGLPTLGGACVYSLAKNVAAARERGGPNMIEQLGTLNIALGLALAAISAWFAVRALVRFLNHHGLEPFGWYRIGLGALLLTLSLTGVIAL
ncbi:MAG: undecaprenyl-diphosphate phosphatase [Phycisphaerales bacterium]|nr:undecaprenyl-diphosphate phosphatase [Phycisphaerales bacterium]